MEQVWYAFPSSCLGMHICVTNILLPAVLKKLRKDVVRLSLTNFIAGL